MPITITPFRSKQNLILVSLIWILLWVVPWGKTLPIQTNIYLAFLIDLIRLGIAMGMFIVPGALLYLLVNKSDDKVANLLEIIVVGFTFSVLLIALIGLSGRVAGLSFLIVKSIFTAVGLVEFILLTVYSPNLNIGRASTESLRSDLINPPLILAVIIATLITLNGYLFFYDDTTYLAYLTNWQFSDALGFKNIVFEGDYIELARFWLAMYPMGQALLASVSGVPGLLLLSNYLELLLVPGAVLTSYWFGQQLGLSRRASGFSALIQVSLFSWMIWNAWPVGTWFFQSMSEDKVSATFWLAPVFFVFVLRFLQSPTRKNSLLLSLSGLSLTLTHPVILFFSCAIAFMIGLFSWILKNSNGRMILHLIVIFAVLMLPYGIIRLADKPSRSTISYDAESASETFQVERYIRPINDVYYGLNPELLKFMDFASASTSIAFQLFRLTPVILMLVAAVWSLFNLKKGNLSWFILACVMLIFFATLPYTGWLLGYFVSARMISRTAWLAPLGLSGMLVSTLFVNWLKSRRIVDANERIKGLKLHVETIGLALCFTFVAPLLLDSLSFQVPLFFQNLEQSRQLTQVGAYIDQNTTSLVTAIALDYDDTQLLPGVSAHTVLISFRDERPYNGHNYFLSVEQSEERIYASTMIRSLDGTISIDKRCSLIKKYELQFVVAEPADLERFENIVKKCGLKLDKVFETNELRLLELK